MSTIREHLKSMHTNRAEHHSAMARLHKEAMDAYESDSPEHVFHKAAAEAHVSAGESETEMARACMKADTGEDLEKRDGLMPTQVSGVAPPYRAVPRPGQREIDSNVRNVEPGLEQFVAVD